MSKLITKLIQTGIYTSTTLDKNELSKTYLFEKAAYRNNLLINCYFLLDKHEIMHVYSNNYKKLMKSMEFGARTYNGF